MAHSLRCRLKELWRRGMLKDGDLERIIIIPKCAANLDVLMTAFPGVTLDKILWVDTNWAKEPYKGRRVNEKDTDTV